MGEAKRKRERYALVMGERLNALHEMIDRPKRDAIKRAFPPGTWVFGIGPHKGCSEVFEGSAGVLQPFDYLQDYDLSHYRVATPAEVMEAMDRVMGQRIEQMEARQ